MFIHFHDFCLGKCFNAQHQRPVTRSPSHRPNTQDGTLDFCRLGDVMRWSDFFQEKDGCQNEWIWIWGILLYHTLPWICYIRFRLCIYLSIFIHIRVFLQVWFMNLGNLKLSYHEYWGKSHQSCSFFAHPKHPSSKVEHQRSFFSNPPKNICMKPPKILHFLYGAGIIFCNKLLMFLVHVTCLYFSPLHQATATTAIHKSLSRRLLCHRLSKWLGNFGQ